MNKKSFLALSFAAIAIVSGYAGIKAFRSQACCENDLLMQNVEALSDNESEGVSTCEGALGICSFNCSSCGYKYWSIGSTFTNRHKCAQQ